MFRVQCLHLFLALCSIVLCAAQLADEKSPAAVSGPPPTQAVPGAQSPPTPGNSASPSPNSSVPLASSAKTTASPLAEALTFYRKGDLTAAIEKFQQVLHDNPTSPDAYAGLTRIYLRQRKVDLAFETASRGLALVDSQRVRVALGEVYFRQGKISEAEQEWVKVVNSGYPDARAYLGVARVRHALSMYKKSKAMIDKAHELDPTDPDIIRYWIGTLTPSELTHQFEGSSNEGVDPADDAPRNLNQPKIVSAQPSKRCRLVKQVTSTEMPLVRLHTDPQHLRGYGLEVSVNGHKTRLLLDTGATGILIDRIIAEKAGVNKISETRVSGIGDEGSKGGYVGTATSIKVGDLEFEDCPVRVLDNRSVANEEGLIGADVFEDYLVNIDFPQEKLRLKQLPKPPEEAASVPATGSEKPPAAPALSRFHDPYIAPEMKNYSRVYRFGHVLLVPTKVGDVPDKLFILDTGAWNNQITPSAAREVTKVRGDSPLNIKGVSGSVKNVYTADKARLQFGHLRQENEDLVAFDFTSISESIGTEVSGTLGFAMLQLLNIKIDYRDGMVDLE
jgi:tetratricopeptide (TPR) repeat protein